MQKKRVAFYTLGCKLNFSETSTLSRQLAQVGFLPVPFSEPADVYVVNTCSVTDHADRKCRKIVNEARRTSPDATVAVVGCYAQLQAEAVLAIPGVNLVLGAEAKFDLANHLAIATSTGKAVAHGHVHAANTFVPAHSEADRTRSFMKVQDGCDYGCTFCTIPQARGASRSDTLANAVARAHALAASGVQEIVLTGCNLGDFGRTATERGRPLGTFHELAAALDAEGPNVRYRISSIEPNLLQPETIALVGASSRFMPHFHIPLQAGSDVLLARMKRRYRTALYRERIEAIKAAMPHASIGVDVIVGFPGETDALFEETYQFLEALPVSYLHVFTYSERPNTEAILLDGVVPGRVRHARNATLTRLSEAKEAAFAAQHIGQTRPVLFERSAKGDAMHGYTDNYIRVQAPYDPLLVNEVTPTFLTEATGALAFGLPLEAPAMALPHA